MVGTVTRSHQFKLIAVGVSRHEDQISNQMILQMIKDAMIELIDFDWSHKVTSHQAGALSNAVTSVWDDMEKLAIKH